MNASYPRPFLLIFVFVCYWLTAVTPAVGAEVSETKSPLPNDYLVALLDSDKTLSPDVHEKITRLANKKDFKGIHEILKSISTNPEARDFVDFFQSQLYVIEDDAVSARAQLESAWKKGSRDIRIVTALAQQWLNFPPNRLAEVADLLVKSENVTLFKPLHPMTRACAYYSVCATKKANSLAVQIASGDKKLMAFYQGKCAEIETLNKNFLLATDLLEKAVATSPQPEPAWLMNLATMMLQLQNYNKTRTYAEMLLKIDPDNQLALDKLSVACYRLRDFAASKEALLRLKNLQTPTDPKILERLKQVEQKLGPTQKP